MMLRLALLLLWLLSWLPLPVLALLGDALGWAAYHLIAERRRVALTNLALCFPQFSQTQRQDLARAHFQAFMTSVLVQGVSWFAPLSRLRRIVQLEQSQRLSLAVAEGPVILLTPHFMGVDTVGSFLSADFNLITINSQQKDRRLEALVKGRRLRWNRGLIFTRQDPIRAVLRALKPGWALYYLPDQDFGPKDSIFVDFFGVPTATIPALAGLARLARARGMGCIVRQDYHHGRITVRFEPLWEHFPSGDEVADTRRMNQFIEQAVLEQPANYLWTHKRFKTRPPGTASVYSSRD